MARHHRYSKRSRESRKAMTDGASDHPDYCDVDDTTAGNWRAATDRPEVPPDRTN